MSCLFRVVETSRGAPLWCDTTVVPESHLAKHCEAIVKNTAKMGFFNNAIIIRRDASDSSRPSGRVELRKSAVRRAQYQVCRFLCNKLSKFAKPPRLVCSWQGTDNGRRSDGTEKSDCSWREQAAACGLMSIVARKCKSKRVPRVLGLLWQPQELVQREASLMMNCHGRLRMLQATTPCPAC